MSQSTVNGGIPPCRTAPAPIENSFGLETSRAKNKDTGIDFSVELTNDIIDDNSSDTWFRWILGRICN